MNKPIEIINKPIEITSMPREIIDNQLLAALDDKSKVACVFDEDDLYTLITGLRRLMGNRALRLRNDLESLRDAAFPEPRKE